MVADLAADRQWRGGAAPVPPGAERRARNGEPPAPHPKADHRPRHYVGTLTNIRPPDSVKYYS